MPQRSHLRSLKFYENWRSTGPHVTPRAPDIRQRRQDVGGPQAARRPLPRAELGGSTQRVRAERRGFRRRRSPGEECADEPGEQVTAAPGGEAGIATRDDVLGAAEIGDDGRNALEQNGALELRRRARRRRPAIVRRF